MAFWPCSSHLEAKDYCIGLPRHPSLKELFTIFQEGVGKERVLLGGGMHLHEQHIPHYPPTCE